MNAPRNIGLPQAEEFFRLSRVLAIGKTMTRHQADAFDLKVRALAKSMGLSEKFVRGEIEDTALDIRDAKKGGV